MFLFLQSPRREEEEKAVAVASIEQPEVLGAPEELSFSKVAVEIK